MQKIIEPIEIGSKHHYLTVTDRIKSGRGYVYNVKCICGTEKTYRQSILTREGKTITSCGCMHKRNMYDTTRILGTRTSTASKFGRYKIDAERRKYVFELSLDEFSNLILSECWYCGKFENFNGIDRVDNAVGYIKSNCVSCCKTCNTMKHTMSLIDFLESVNRILEHQKLK